ncbi:hypothetical protein AB0M43_36460 [Longispora sp. NPDC051575]|uniref:hypothetical protein n=1 Tax=Longispora sp. NPDC051575 TaxID=3154943 RepID=UPI0034317A4F
MTPAPPVPLTAIAARFPLIARNRPPARPLKDRLRRLTAKADALHAEPDTNTASQILNGGTLLMSDCGDSELARAWCRRHAAAYLDRPAPDGHAARAALEPLINLARLRIRDGDGDGAHQLLTALHKAITSRTSVTIDGIELTPEHMPTDPAEHAELTALALSALLSDGLRALISAGRWLEAVDQLLEHNAVTPRLWDGRQIAIVARLIDEDTITASVLLNATVPGDSWEQAVHGLLNGMCQAKAGTLIETSRRALLDLPFSCDLPTGLGLARFRVRLALATVDLAGQAPVPLLNRLCAQVIAEADAHAGSELLHHPALADRQRPALLDLIQAAGLGQGQVPEPVRTHLCTVLDVALGAVAAHTGGPNSLTRP